MRWKNKKVKTKLRQNSNRKKINKNGAKKREKNRFIFPKNVNFPLLPSIPMRHHRPLVDLHLVFLSFILFTATLQVCLSN
jgi:hypothetical protein